MFSATIFAMTEASCSALIRACTHCSDEDKKRIKHAFKLTSDAHVGQMRRDGTPYITHPLEVSTILAQWGADADTIITGLLHDTVEDTNLTLQEINEQFGGEVASLVEGVTKFTQADFAGMESMDDEVETLRRLFEVMRKDIRVVIIKIADRLHNLRTIEGLSEDRRISFSRESLDIYYKIAYHLCMNDVCREITNICVPYVFPEKAQIREEHWKKQFAEAQDAAKKIEAELRAVHGNNIQEIQLIKSSHDLPRISEEDEASDRA